MSDPLYGRSVEEIQQEIHQRWDKGDFIDQVTLPTPIPWAGSDWGYDGEPYVQTRTHLSTYYDYGIMIQERYPSTRETWRPGLLGSCWDWVFGTRECPLHTHPHSDRVVTVLSKGLGYFIAIEHKPEIRSTTETRIVIRRGDRIWIPRGVRHTFHGGANPLIVEAIHNPWIPPNDTRYVRY